MSGPAQVSGATGLDTGLSRTQSSTNLAKAGTRFEAMFDGMMLTAMRATHLADPLLGSKAIDTFTELGDARLAQSMAEHQPIGIGRAMTAFLAKQGAAPAASSQPDGNASPASLSP